MTPDPTRLLDDPSVAPSLRDDLGAAAQVEVAGLDLAGGLAALQQATAAGAPAASTSLATKLGLGAALCGGAVALWLAWGGTSPTAAPTAAPQVAGPVAAPEELPARGPAPAEDGSEAAPEPSEAPERADDRLAEPAAVTGDLVEPELVEPEPVEPEPVEPELVETEPSSRSYAGHEARVHRGDPTPEPSAEPLVDDVLREARLVAKARSKLAREPAAALALADEAEHDFPKGQLIEERRAIAIRALLALGRTSEARRRAEPFLSTYGRGAHAAAVRRDLAKAKPIE